MKKILLIGGSGQLGSALIEDARTFGFEIISFARSELDVTNVAQLRQKIGETKCDVLVNASAYHVAAECEKNPETAMRVNFVSVVAMAHLCKERTIPFVTYSTFYVFDGEKGEPYEEDDAPHPLQVYSISKLAGEYGAAAAYPDGAIIIRTGALYGGGRTGSPQKGGNFVLDILKEAEAKDRIEVSCEQIANPTFAGDLSKATLKLLEMQMSISGGRADAMFAGIYHLVNEGYASYYEFAKEILMCAGKKATVVPVARSAGKDGVRRPTFAALANTRAAAKGIVLPPWKEGLASYMSSII